MKIIECAQGSPEWHSARAGVITASMFSTIRKKVGCLDERQAMYVKAVQAGQSEREAMELAGYKAVPRSDIITRALKGEKIGDWSDAAKDYAFRLAIERISGQPLDEGFETWAMRRGRELEHEARMEHEALTGLLVEQTGFITTDDSVFGASADGLIDPNGGSEYKCFVDPARLRPILLEGNITEIRDQAQGCMWISGRQWWHVGLYCPALANADKQFTMIETPRDDDFIEVMELELMEFARFVDEYETALRRKAA